MTADQAGVSTSIRVERYEADAARWARARLALPVLADLSPAQLAQAGVRPYSVTEDHDCNMWLLAAWTVMLGGISGTTITNKFASGFGRIGWGTSTAGVVATQTSLQGDTGGGSTTSYYQLCGVAPTVTVAAAPATMVFTATHGAGVANFAWNEFGTDNWNASGVTAQGLGATEVFVNRGLSPQGTKQAGQIWVTTETISFGYPSATGAVS